jgi:hypothetical protein
MSAEATPARRGRPRKYASAAEKSRAYRERVKQRVAALEARAAGETTPPGALPDDGKPRTGKELLDALIAAGVVGMWADRTDIGDSVEYARQLRRQAERREWD